MLKTILYWAFGISVGLFSIFFLIGAMAEWRYQFAGPRLRGGGPQDAEEKVRTCTPRDDLCSEHADEM